MTIEGRDSAATVPGRRPELLAENRELAADNRVEVDRFLVVLAPGEAFGQPDWFRIGFGLHREGLLEGLGRLGSFLERGRAF